MSLNAYSYSKPLHTDAMRAPVDAHTADPHAARGNASRYAATATQRAIEALHAGDVARALFWQERANHWAAYAVKLRS